jgi:5'-3' exonuclease
VLPPQSAKLLPKPYAELMLQDESPIADFYPKEFVTDANGKRQPWEAVVKIPFIAGDRLLDTVNLLKEEDLSEAEKRRNLPGKEHTFVPPK